MHTQPLPRRLNLVPLLQNMPSDDEASNKVADIVRSYPEIDTLPKKVAVHFLMATLMHWQIQQDEDSYLMMPEWLRPTDAQISTLHAAWIDRIAWPRVRDYLISHSEITLDEFAKVYSSNFSINWDYDHGSVVTPGDGSDHNVYLNPVFEDHIRQLKNWTVDEPFRRKFPTLAEIIDGRHDP
jgi:hypothetical protein